MAIDGIRAQIEALPLAADRASIAAGFEALDLLAARLAVAVGEFEAAGRHQDHGAVSMHGWLRHVCRRDHRTAARLTVTGRLVRRLPVTRAAALDGTLSGGQLERIVANVPARHVERFAEHEAELVPILADLPVDQSRHAMEHWKRRADALDPGPGPQERANELRVAKTIDARGELRESFDADTTAIVDAALRVADPNDRERSLAERRADALAQVCQHFLDHQRRRPGGRHRPHLNVVVLRDGGCRMPGCDAPASRCDVHHALPWEHGGDTALANGVLLCRRHHRMTHRPRHHLKLLPSGTVEHAFPDGRIETSEPRGPTATTLWREPRPDGT